MPLPQGMFARTRPREEGVSLLEVCIAAGVLASATVSLAALFTAAMGTGRQARYRTLSAIIALERVETLRQDASRSAGAIAGVDWLGADGADVGTPDAAGFAREWSAEPFGAGLVRITVAVRPHAPGAPALNTARIVSVVRSRAAP